MSLLDGLEVVVKLLELGGGEVDQDGQEGLLVVEGVGQGAQDLQAGGVDEQGVLLLREGAGEGGGDGWRFF